MPFEIGKAQVLLEGGDVTIIATGHLVWKALQASDMLFEKGIHATVINMHTIKPLDAETVIRSVSTTGCVVTAEEHQCNGGLGEAIAQLLAAHHPVPIEWVAVNDTFGESGTPEQLLVKYGLDAPDILNKALKVIERKKGK
jgi:transketolase